jgi:hypothetical protein
VLREGAIAYLAVRTRWGPHLTPVVYSVDGGRLWVTTARRSVKARRWRLDPEVAGLVAGEAAAVTFRGSARTYDALDPFSWPGAVMAGPRLVEAAARFTLKNARFFAGYAVDAGRVPLAWTPPGRVFAAIRPAQGQVVHGEPEEVVGWGSWPTGARYHGGFAPLRPIRGLDLRVPGAVRRGVGEEGMGALALDGDAGLTVLKVPWRRNAREGAYEAVVPVRVLELANAGPDVPAALTVDHASQWRASEMKGMLLQGIASLHALEWTRRGRGLLRDRLGDRPGHALVRLRPDRVVWWEGWTAGSAARLRVKAVAAGGRA